MLKGKRNTRFRDVDAVEGTDYVIMWKDKNGDCFKTIANIYTPQQLTTGKEELQNKLFKLKQLQKQVKSIQINEEYTWSNICNLIQTIKVYKDKLIVTIDINGIVFTEELIY